MTRMNIKISSFVLLVCGTLPFAYSESVYQISVKGNRFEPVRPKHPPKIISECDTVVTEPYGLLEQTFKRGQAKKGASCSWTLRAPANHVVNVISIGSELLDRISSEKHEDFTGSFIGLYDGVDASRPMFRSVSSFSYARGGMAFVESISSKQDMIVKINYHDMKGYVTQKIAIKYEFLNVDDMYRLLRAH